MGKRKYTHVQGMLPEVKEMRATGKSYQEIAEHFGLKDKKVIKKLLERERKKERNIAAGILPRPKGRPRKAGPSSSQDAEAEIKRLRMENQLLRDFLRLTGRGSGPK